MATFVIQRSNDDPFMFNLKANNGEIIPTSELYSSKVARDKAIESVTTNAPAATVHDAT